MQLSEENSSTEFRLKPLKLQILINEALEIITLLDIPLENLSGRRLERIALAFLAVADVREPGHWSELKDAASDRSLRTRDIITYINQNFFENISSGSYDDIRRKDLALLVMAEVVVRTHPNVARNNSLRGYAINPEFAQIIRKFKPNNWQEVELFLKDRVSLADRLSATRNIAKTVVALPSGVMVEFSPGEHNLLQKAIIEEFLPRYGHNSQVLYVGDSANKFLLLDREALNSLSFFELSHGELPDVVAYSQERDWLYLIEAVHTSGPISPLRLLNLRQLTSTCTSGLIFVTAFLNRETFRRFIGEIAWETEVWIAEEPDHLIHFDGQKFLGPYL